MVDVFIRYPANSVVDMNAVTSKLVSNTSSGIIVPNNIATKGGEKSADASNNVSTSKSTNVSWNKI